MGIENIRRWQWIVVALMIGAGIGFVRRRSGGDATSRFSLLLSGQGEFERALLEKGDGVPRFRDLTVYEEKVPGTNQTVYVVGGLYTRFQVKDGQTYATPAVRACFVFPSPYQLLAEKGKPAKAGTTVVDYLESLRGQGVVFRKAWWNSTRASVALWAIASLVVIGGIWPTLVNLLAFGQWAQPPRESFDVGGISTPTAPGSEPKITDDDLARLKQLDAALEAEISAGDAARPRPSIESSSNMVKALNGGPLESAAVSAPQDDREFGADRDDFYPTERHAPPKRPG